MSFIKNCTVFLYLLSCTLVASYLYRFPICGIDDANIYFIYMKHFSQGNGFVYNINSEKVEGFTSILWTLIGSSFYLFTKHIEICLFLLNIILAYLLLKISLKIIEKLLLQHNQYYFLFFLGLLFILPGFYDWILFSLLETGLWSFMLLLLCYLLIEPYFDNNQNFKKSNILICLLFPIFVLTRPESSLLGFVIIAIRFFQILFNEYKIKHAILSVLPMVIVFTSSLYLITTWRLSYFGYPFPNTYYIKISDTFLENLKEGVVYLIKYIVRVNPFIVLMITSYAVWIIDIIKKKEFTAKNNAIITILCIIFFSFLIPFYTGGDHFGLSRFYQPYVPLYYIAFIYVLDYYQNKMKFISIVFTKKQNIFLMLFLMSILPLKNLYLFAYKKSSPISIEFNIAKENRKLGKQLNLFFDSINKPSIGVITAGAIAYTYEGKTFDLLGLNNTEIAHAIDERPTNILKNHRAFNKRIFYKLKPELFIFRFIKAKELFQPYSKIKNVDTEFGSKVIKHIYKDVEFNNNYTFALIENTNTKQLLTTYISNDFLEKIKSISYYKILAIN